MNSIIILEKLSFLHLIIFVQFFRHCLKKKFFHLKCQFNISILLQDVMMQINLSIKFHFYQLILKKLLKGTPPVPPPLVYEPPRFTMERALRAYYQAICFALLFISSGSSSKVEKPPLSEDLSLWIDSQQVKMYSGKFIILF